MALNRLNTYSNVANNKITPNNTVKKAPVSKTAVKNHSFNTSVSFQGKNPVIKGVSKFMSWLDKGSVTQKFVKGFLILDGLGFIAPRIVQATLRNKEELGHLNINAGIEETIREGLSGPGLFIIPYLLVNLAKNKLGSATDIEYRPQHIFASTFENMSTKIPGNKITKRDFYKDILNQSFALHLENKQAANQVIKGKTTHGQIDEMLGAILELDKHIITKANLQKQKSLFMPLSKRKEINAQIKIIEKNKIHNIKTQINNIVISLNKKHNLLLNDKSSILIKHKGLNKPFKEYASSFFEDMFSYSHDIIEKTKKIVASEPKEKALDVIKKLNKRTRGARNLLNIANLLACCGFLYLVPILYKRNKTYPGLAGLKENNTPPTKQGGIHAS